MKRRGFAWSLVAMVIALMAGVLASAGRTAKIEDGDVPLASVQLGEIDLKSYALGELRASRAMVLTAPSVSGGALQITRLLRTGAPVKKGDIVFEFDPAEQRYKLEQSRSEVLQADEEITKAKADSAVQTAEDKVALLKARFELRRAELEVQKNELVSVIDAKKNDLALEQAKNSLAKLEQDIESHTASGSAAILLAREKRNKANLAMQQAQHNIEKMIVPAPMDGLVSVERNGEAMGDSMWPGMSVPDFRAGDQVRPGSTIAQIIDPTQMELSAKVGEQERGNLKVGQATEIEFDALPGQIFAGTVKTVGGMSTHQFWEANTGGKFEITIQLSGADPRLRPGLTAEIAILGEKKKNVLYVPRLALFVRDGKPVVYVKNSKDFEQRTVKIQYENESRAAIEGLKALDRVALTDPTAPRSAGSSSQPDTSGALR